jgi:hypothetical protein
MCPARATAGLNIDGDEALPAPYAARQSNFTSELLINHLILHHSHPDAQRYLGFFFARMPPVFPETDFCSAPFAALPATLPTSGTKVGFAVVP